jgi:hypothetical protein
MYGKNRVEDTKRALRAISTNQFARWAPRLYIRLTAQTGRGAEQDSPREVADYFRRCFDEYFEILQVRPDQIPNFLSGKQVLEYGPGDIPGVAMLLIAHGAESVVCVDRFPLFALSPKNIKVLSYLLDDLEGEARRRAESCFMSGGDPASGLSPCIRYLIRPSGLSGLLDAVDLIISRAVLEHVDDLFATYADMHAALRSGGLAAHEVDLKSHGLHRKNPLDFLSWPPRLWSWMYSHKGVPNRWRVNHHRQAIAESGLNILLFEPVVLADQRDIEEVRGHLASPFQSISNADLSWLGFWAILQKSQRARQDTTAIGAET